MFALAPMRSLALLVSMIFGSAHAKDDLASNAADSPGRECESAPIVDRPQNTCSAPAEDVQLDRDGTIRLSGISIPYSSLSSQEAKRNFLELANLFAHGWLQGTPCGTEDISCARTQLDNRVMRPGVEKLRKSFAVRIRSEKIAGVATDAIEPIGGPSDRNKGRVLINLHGGGFAVAAGLGGQMESIPIASVGEIAVISVDYRQGPEHRFPAASEDVEAVYRELLRRGYSSKNIGIYGCSAGAMLTAQAIARLHRKGLPLPGAIGMFGGGALIPMKGDSNSFGALLNGHKNILTEDAKKLLPYFDVPKLDVSDPLVSPAYSPNTLAAFPPALLISGTRDMGLSAVVYTHAQLIQAHVVARLHVWEGASHCSFAQPFADPEVPETRQAWNVIAQFFDEFLGT